MTEHTEAERRALAALEADPPKPYVWSDKRAHSEGWWIAGFHISDCVLQIQRLDVADKLDGDADAARLVVDAAIGGSGYHRAALYIATGAWPRESYTLDLSDPDENDGARSYRTEFPDFDPATMPELPGDFVDHSWRNESCPHFASSRRGVSLWIDYAKPEDREVPEMRRFWLARVKFDEDGAPAEPPSDGEELAFTDDWAAIIAALPPLES